MGDGRRETISHTAQNWQSTCIAGKDGCRILIWPIETFMSIVTADVALQQGVCSVARDVVENPENNSALTNEAAYFGMLKMAVVDGQVLPVEKRSLNEYRMQLDIPLSKHNQMLEQLGWTQVDWNDGIQK